MPPDRVNEEPDANGFVSLGAVVRDLCENYEQTQYVSRYLTGLAPTQLGDGLRVDLSGFEHGGDYHAIRIHLADAPEFARRVHEHRRATGQIA
jgi:hypothetical protein